MATSIFNYSDPLHFITDIFSQRKISDPNFTVRGWAAEMELDSPALLAMILKEERPLKVRFVEFLSKGLKLDPAEQLFFKVMIMMKTAKTKEEKDTLEVVMRCLIPKDHFKATYTQNTSLFDHWSTMAIFSATRIKGISTDENELSRLFSDRVDIGQIKESIALLEKEGVITRNDGLLKPAYDRVSTQNEVSNDGAKKYYQQVLELAKDAVNLPVEDRAFQSFSLAIRKDQLPVAKELILELRNKLDALESNDATQVYQTNLQFFPLSKEIESVDH